MRNPGGVAGFGVQKSIDGTGRVCRYAQILIQFLQGAPKRIFAVDAAVDLASEYEQPKIVISMQQHGYQNAAIALSEVPQHQRHNKISGNEY